MLKGKILIVDDESSIRFFLQELLKKDGHHVTAVASGEKALEQIAKQGFDLALIDLKLEDISGTEVLYTLSQTSPDTVVIMLTGQASLESAVEALRQGAHDYLFKPCKADEIRESIQTGLQNRQQRIRQRQLLFQLEQNLSNTLRDIQVTRATIDDTPLPPTLSPAPAAQPDTTLEKEGLRVDLAQHLITLKGKRLHLSPTEFDVLAYLISESPRVISPEELMREVQGYESEPWEANDTIRYHVYRIRKKIRETTGEENIIKTVRGIGYAVR
ncbi:MAG: response regulator transcription factor [Anaerolineales bacterium]